MSRSTIARRPAALLLSLVTAAVVLPGAVSPASSQAAAPPPNDDRADAQVFSGLDGSLEGTTVGATTAPDERQGPSVWFAWTAPDDGLERIQVPGTPVAVYGTDAGRGVVLQGRSCESYIAIFSACSYVRATAGTTYLVEVGTYDDGAGPAPFTLQWSRRPAPQNDDLADAEEVPGGVGRQDFPYVVEDQTGYLATLEPGEEAAPFPEGPATHSIWYQWTASRSGTATFAASIVDYSHGACYGDDPFLEISTGTGIDDLVVKGSAYGSSADCSGAEVVLPATQGTTYHVMVNAVDGPTPITGSVTLAPDCTIGGTKRADTIVGTPGDDVLCGGGGNDVLRGNGGEDVVLGGAGVDTVTYARADGPVRANLLESRATGRGNDVFEDVENLVGSPYDDHLHGDSRDNRLVGGAGDDALVGSVGSDTLLGGRGRDVCGGGRGSDTAVACEITRRIP